MLDANFGTAIGYADNEGALRTNPRPSVVVDGQALYVLVDEGQTPTSEAVAAVLAKAAPRTA